MKVSFVIDGKKLEAPAGEKVLWVALAHGIYIPNLCALEEMPEPAAACRLCFVEVRGEKEPVPACVLEVREGLEVNTRGEKALWLARKSFELLMSSHPVECARCARRGACELTKIARHLGVRLRVKELRPLARALPLDETHPLFVYDPRKCVLCGRCVWICREKGEGVLGFAYRGFRRVVTTFGGKPLGEFRCEDCRACVLACPTGALAFKGVAAAQATARRQGKGEDEGEGRSPSRL